MATDRLSDEDLKSLIEDLLRRELVARLHYVRVAVPVIGFAGTFLAVVSLGSPGSADFYKSAATIIPTLLLTLAVQGRFFRLRNIAESPVRQALKRKEISRSTLQGLGATRWQARQILSSAKTLSQPAGQARRYVVILLGILSAGEGCTLYVLASSAQTAWLLGVVSGAIAAGLLAIAVVALIDLDVQLGGAESGAGDAAKGWQHVLSELAARRGEPGPKENEDGTVSASET